MAQYELDLRDYGRILIKRKRVIIFATLLVGFITFLITPQPQPIYKAKSSVRITQSSTLAGLFIQTISYSRWNNLETQAKIIRSLPVVTITAQRLGLVDPNLNEREIINSPEDVKIVNDLIENIYTEQYGKTDIIEIVTSADDPNKAREFANTLADVFVEYSTLEKNRQVDQAASFIYDQLQTYKKRLEETEKKIEKFKRNNIDALSLSNTEMSDVRRELEMVSTQRKSLEIQMQQLRNRRSSEDKSYIDMFQIEGVSAEEGQLSALGEMNRKLVSLQMEKETLLIYQTNKSPEVLDLEQQIQKLITDLLKEFEVQLTALREREEKLRNRLELLPQNDTEYDRLLREKSVNQEIYSLLRTKYQEAQIKQSERVQEMSVVEYATYAQKFIKGGKWSKTIMGLVVGLLLGLVVAFVLETLDTSIGAIQDVEEYLKTTVLGVIPHFEKEEVRERILRDNPQAVNDQYIDFYSMLVSQFRPKSPIAEAYRTLATNIDFVRLRHEGANEFVISSSTMREGKSTTLANLAIAMAQMGHRTLIVGCNLRRPSIYKIFGLEMGPGVRDISLGLVHWREAVRNINDIALGKMSVTENLLKDGAWSRLHIVTCGAIYHNPAEIFNTPKMVQFLREAKKEFDVVLIDSPPILPVTDAAILGSRVDGVILVYQVGKVARGALKRAKQHLEAVNSQVWGVILNDFKAEISGFAPDTAYYGKYYGGDVEETRESQTFFERMMTTFTRHSDGSGIINRILGSIKKKFGKTPTVEHIEEEPPASEEDENADLKYDPITGEEIKYSSNNDNLSDIYDDEGSKSKDR